MYEGKDVLKYTMYTKYINISFKIVSSFRHQYEYYRNICKYMQMICRKIDEIREMETEKMSLLGGTFYSGHIHVTLVRVEEVVGLSQDIDPK